MKSALKSLGAFIPGLKRGAGCCASGSAAERDESVLSGCCGATAPSGACCAGSTIELPSVAATMGGCCGATGGGSCGA